MKRLVILLLCLTGTACTTVQPWERGYLAQRDMQWAPDGPEQVFLNHMHNSKEAASGGFGAAGGGCGCN